jgi:hypothetical protein
MGVESIKIEPVDVYIGEDAAQVQKVTTVADVSSSLNDKYFVLYSPTVKYLVWLNIGSAGSAPVISGYTNIEVTAAANATASAIATAVQTAVDGHAAFVATVSGNVVTITNAATGAAPFAHDSQSAKTGFAFEVTTVGDAYEKIGLIDGDIEVGGLSRSPVDIMAHQKGTTILGQILTGSGNPELSFSIKEFTKAKFEKVLRYSTSSYYPVAASSTSVVGGGSLGQFKTVNYTKVVLHPVRLGVADKSADICMWKCALDLESFTLSGENIVTLPVTVKAFEDDTKAPNISTWMLGDWSQTLTA